MVSPRVIGVTGAAGYWGSRLAQRLSELGHRVIALDQRQPATPLEGVEFIEVDLRNPLLPDFFENHSIQQLLHLDFKWERRATEAGFEHNIMGATRLLGAATKAQVRQVVFMSHTMAYGARADNPAYISETTRARGVGAGYARHLTEIEDLISRLREEDERPALTVLRFAHIVGPTAPSLMNDMLKLWATPTLLGFDPLMQLVHEDDVAAALEHALLGWDDAPLDGAVNIGAFPPIPLAKLLHAAGVTPVPVLHPIAYAASRVTQLGSAVRQAQPLDWDYLRYPVVGDLTKMSTEFGFTPSYDTDAIMVPLIERGAERRAMLSLKRSQQADIPAPEEAPNA